MLKKKEKSSPRLLEEPKNKQRLAMEGKIVKANTAMKQQNI